MPPRDPGPGIHGRRRYRNTRWPLPTDPALTVVLIVIALAIAASFLGA